MAKFTHYLVTRFNIRIDGLGPENFRPSARTESWVSDRMPLFENFCAPSVAGQKNKDFHWLIYCDAETEKSILDRISMAIRDVYSSEIVFVSDFKEMLSHLRNKIQKRIQHMSSLRALIMTTESGPGIIILIRNSSVYQFRIH